MNISSLSTLELVNQFCLAATDWGKLVENVKSDQKKVDAAGARVRNAAMELKQRGGEALDALLTLVDHEDLAIRMRAANFTMDISQRSIDVLEEIGKDLTSEIAWSARTALEIWSDKDFLNSKLT